MHDASWRDKLHLLIIPYMCYVLRVSNYDMLIPIPTASSLLALMISEILSSYKSLWLSLLHSKHSKMHIKTSKTAKKFRGSNPRTPIREGGNPLPSPPPARPCAVAAQPFIRSQKIRPPLYKILDPPLVRLDYSLTEATWLSQQWNKQCW